jgi:hypothetical protein
MTVQQNPSGSQGRDGCPHFTYFQELSFVWDGISDHIEVSQTGYGERVIDIIPIHGLGPGDQMTAGKWLVWFRDICRNYLNVKNGGG